MKKIYKKKISLKEQEKFMGVSMIILKLII